MYHLCKCTIIALACVLMVVPAICMKPNDPIEIEQEKEDISSAEPQHQSSGSENESKIPCKNIALEGLKIIRRKAKVARLKKNEEQRRNSLLVPGYLPPPHSPKPKIKP